MMQPGLHNSWKKLEAQKKHFEDSINGESLLQLEFKPAPGSWSMLQVLEHIVTTEKMSSQFLVNKALLKSRKAGGKWHVGRALFLSLMLKSPLKFKVPKIKGINPNGELTKETLFLEWDAGRQELYAFLEKFPEDKLDDLIFRHPVVGWLTIKETIVFFADHINHHQQQLVRIRKSSDFPDF